MKRHIARAPSRFARTTPYASTITMVGTLPMYAKAVESRRFLIRCGAGRGVRRLLHHAGAELTHSRFKESRHQKAGALGTQRTPSCCAAAGRFRALHCRFRRAGRNLDSLGGALSKHLAHSVGMIEAQGLSVPYGPKDPVRFEHAFSSSARRALGVSSDVGWRSSVPNIQCPVGRHRHRQHELVRRKGGRRQTDATDPIVHLSFDGMPQSRSTYPHRSRSW